MCENLNNGARLLSQKLMLLSQKSQIEIRAIDVKLKKYIFAFEIIFFIPFLYNKT